MSKKNKNRKKHNRTNNIESQRKIVIRDTDPLIAHYENGRFWFTGRDGKVIEDGPFNFTRSYIGENKERVVARATNLPGAITNVGSWVMNFDVIFAIDTNTEKYKDIYISAGAVCQGTIVKESKDSGTINSGQWLIFDWYHRGNTNMETKTWVETIKIIQLAFSSDTRIGIVIDSELGNLEDYNNRKIPLRDNFYLPENFIMMYASADRTDEWCNGMIRQCDDIAKKRLREIVLTPAMTHITNSRCEEILGHITIHETLAERKIVEMYMSRYVTVVVNP